MGSYDDLQLWSDLEASFGQLLDAALKTHEFAVPARRLGFSDDGRLKQIVSRRRALEQARESHGQWWEAQQALWDAESAAGQDEKRLLRTSASRRALHALRRALPGGASAETRRAQRRGERLDEIRQLVEARAHRAHERREACLDVLYEQSIVRPLRAFFNERSGKTWSRRLTLSAADAPGLAELRTAPSVQLGAGDEVERLIAQMPGGSIGISGPRGAGKTTLIRRLTHPSPRDKATLGAYVSAPTRYDAREFVVHLFATVCHAVRFAASPIDPHMDYGQLTAGAFIARRLLTPRWAGVALLVASGLLVTFALLGATIDARLLVGLACAGMASAAASAALDSLLRGLLSFLPLLWSPERHLELRFRSVSGTLAGGLVMVGGGLIALSQLTETTPPWAWGALGAGCALALLATSWAAASHSTSRITRRPPEFDHVAHELAQTASGWLERLRFQTTLTRGWNGSVRLPLLQGGVSGDRTLATRPMTLPELVGALETFIRQLARQRRVVIGIDELDKMASERHVHTFLNEIKGVFGIRDCYFLVSVSEEAMANFALRDARLRDAFDSAFDEVVQLRVLDLEQSRAILSERVIGLPQQFAALCHVLSGGLPRDLIRAARAVLAQNEPGGRVGLRRVVRCVVTHELGVRVRAASIAMRSLGTQSTPFLEWVAQVGDAAAEERRAVAALGEICTDAEIWRTASGLSGNERESLRQVVRELQGFCYFALTVHDVFDDRLDRPTFEAMQARRASSLDALASARATFAHSVLLGWSEVSAFRRANGLTAFAAPELSVGGSISFGSRQ